MAEKEVLLVKDDVKEREAMRPGDMFGCWKGVCMYLLTHPPTLPLERACHVKRYGFLLRYSTYVLIVWRYCFVFVLVCLWFLLFE